MTFGQYLRMLRKRQRMSVRELAKQLSISSTYVYDVETDNRMPFTKDKIDIIVKALDIDDVSRNILYDLSAKARHTIPDDIKEYLMTHQAMYITIREEIARNV